MSSEQNFLLLRRRQFLLLQIVCVESSMRLRDGKKKNPINLSIKFKNNNNNRKDIYSLYVEMIGSTSNEKSETAPLVHEAFDESSGGGSSKRQIVSLEIMSVDVDEDSPITQEADEGSKLVNVEVPQCRICLDTGGEDLIAPCYCKGTQKYVHRTCLDNWRSTKEGFAFAHCTECRAVFILRANVPADRWWLRLKFNFLVIRDHAFLFIIVQLVVASLGLLVYRFYGDKMQEMFDYEEHPYGFYSMAVIAVMLVGLLYGVFIAIIFGQRISERHYHVLEKQELTKEYIVENRDENTDPPELNSSHVTELRIMGLY